MSNWINWIWTFWFWIWFQIFSQFGSQSHPYFSQSPALYSFGFTAHTSSLAILRDTRLLQAVSVTVTVTPGARGALKCADLSHPLLTPPPSFGAVSQLCHSTWARLNSALGRARDSKPRPSVCKGKLKPQPHSCLSPLCHRGSDKLNLNNIYHLSHLPPTAAKIPTIPLHVRGM